MIKKNSIETLLNTDPAKIGNAALKQAVEAQRKQNEEREGQRALALLNQGDTLITQRVNAVRALRKREQEEIALLKKLDKARTEFIAGGNADAFETAMREVRSW